MTAAITVGPLPWQGIAGEQVAICALIYFYVHGEPLNEAGPMLSRLLSYTTRLLFRVDPPSRSLPHFLQLLYTAVLPNTDQDSGGDVVVNDDAKAWADSIGILIKDSCSLSGLHRFFTKVEHLLVSEEEFDEVHNITIKPAERKIDEQSPFGHFLQRCLDKYISLEDDDFARVVRDLQHWEVGELFSSSSREIVENPRSMASAVPTSALQRGDYSLARAHLEGFFDRAPQETMGNSLQETLLLNATFHYQTKAFKSARSSISESLRLSRGVNDLDCIAACDSLLRRIDYEDEEELATERSSHTEKEPPVFSLQDLWQVDKERDKGRPLLAILISLNELMRQEKMSARVQDNDLIASHQDFAECCLRQAQVWSQCGSLVNSSAFLDACILERSVSIEWNCSERLDLPVAILQAEMLVEAGKIEEALCFLFASPLVKALSLSLYQKWQGAVWRAVYKAGLNAGSIETMKAVQAVRPEVVREVEGEDEDLTWDVDMLSGNEYIANEVSFDRNLKPSLTQILTGKLREARTCREQGNDNAIALTIATHVLRRAEESHLFDIYRRAAVECSEALLGSYDASRAREMIGEVMPHLLRETGAEVQGDAAWLYARIELTLCKRGEADLATVPPWLIRASDAYRASGSTKSLLEVLYVLAEVYERLNLQKETVEARKELEAVLDTLSETEGQALPIFAMVQSMVISVGARIIAGG